MKEEKLTEKVAFDLIRYANCWEDADILLKGLSAKPGGRILSIGSAGDNSFSLLLTDPEMVVAVDVNPVQLWLIELKQQAIAQLDYEDVLAFLGFRPSKERLILFNHIKSALSKECRAYWELQKDTLQAGVISQGKFEGYFQFFARRILPWIHSRKQVEELLRPKSVDEQEQFYEKYWNTWRWRFFFKLFFSRYVMGKYGRDPEFLKEVEVSVGKTIYAKAGAHLRTVNAQRNYFLRYTLTGSFGDLLPHYLQPEHFRIIQTRINRLQLCQGFAEDAIRIHGTFTYMNLSNIFEYMNPELFQKTASQLIEAMEPGGRLAYWNLMVPRRISAQFPDKVEYLETLSKRLTASDNGFFYQQFIADHIL